MAKSAGPRGDPQVEDVGLHVLVAAGGSKLNASRALRAREVSRPTVAQLAEAEGTVVLQRAHRSGNSPVPS